MVLQSAHVAATVIISKAYAHVASQVLQRTCVCRPSHVSMQLLQPSRRILNKQHGIETM